MLSLPAIQRVDLRAVYKWFQARRRRVRLVLATAFLAAMVLWWLSPRGVAPVPAGSAVDRKLVFDLLRYAVADRANSQSHDQMGHWSIFIPDRVAERIWVQRYAQEKILNLGRSAIGPLIDVIEDSRIRTDLRAEAVCALAFYDDDRVVPALKRVGQARWMGSFELLIALNPFHCHWDRTPSVDVGSPEYLQEWIEALAMETKESYLIAQLDRTMAADAVPGEGLQEGLWDRRCLAWLDRVYDVDLSDWLARYAPEALEFRERTFAKGFDPVIAFEYLAHDSSNSYSYRGVAAVLSDPADQRACRELLEAVHDSSSHLHPVRQPGWTSALRTWYWSNRAHLRYDEARHRLVVDLRRQDGVGLNGY